MEELRDFDYTRIGITTGHLSLSLEAFDFDLKNIPNGAEHKRYMEMFNSKIPEDLLAKLVIQKTVSGGYHYIYRCSEIESSMKLANNEQGKAIIETRGEGGYIQVYPTEGYEMIQGSFDKIPLISPEERATLFASAIMMSKTLTKEIKKRQSKEDRNNISKWEEYNEDPEKGLDILFEHGWTLKGEDDDWYNLTRPDSKSGGLHAGYNKELNFLYVFSTSQEWFQTEKPYNNHDILAILEYDGNYPRAYAELYKMYPDAKDGSDNEEDDFKRSLELMDFLSDEQEENGYLEQARKNQIEQGLTTGWTELDKHYRFKENSLDIGLGYDGVGKSLVITSMATASNVLHGWKWGMIMPENRTAMTRRRLIEALSGESINRFDRKPEEFEEWKQYTRDNFKIISNKRHWSILEVIEMGKRLVEVYGIKALLIDPYNFFKVTGNGYSFNNEILSQLRVFAETYCSVYLMAHPSSEAPRKRIDQLGYLAKPQKYDIQGGADFPYRVDNFFTIHRIVNHEDKNTRKIVQFCVEKIKETETGGMVHNQGEWTELSWDIREGFMGYYDDDGNNPMRQSLLAKRNVNELNENVKVDPLKPLTTEDAFGDFEF